MVRRAQRRQPASPAAVHLDGEWIARWLPRLGPQALTTYVALASLAPRLPEPNAPELTALLGDEGAQHFEAALARLQALGLIEVIEARGSKYVHLRCVGADGRHRAEPTRPSIREALAEHRRMMEELLAVDAADDSPELRERIFERYPELRKRWLARGQTGDGTRRGWRMWLELALVLMSRFEERFGELKREHAPLFKEASAQALRLKLEMIEQVTRAILAHRDEIFPTRGAGWIAGLNERAFTALPLVRELANRYQVGAEQIYLNTLEALANEGLALVELDEQGRVLDLRLANTTGLAPNEERLAFFRLDELSDREIDAIEQTLERMVRARERYRTHLIEHALAVLIDLARRHRVADPDRLAALAAQRINEQLELVRPEGDHPRALVPTVSAEEIRRRLREALGAPTGAPRDGEGRG